MTVIIFLIVLAVLIFVHELGHFLAARIFGIRVDSFKIGFGPKIVAWHFKDKNGSPGETEYGLNWIPFGGYVKIFGEDPNDENTHGPDAARSFVHKPRWQQAIVLAAGVLFNFIFAGLLYIGVFSTGVVVSTDSFPQYAASFQNERIVITDVLPGSPADKAGLQAGDVVTSFSDTYAHYEESGGVVYDFPGYGEDNISTFQGPDGDVTYLESVIDSAGSDLAAAQKQYAADPKDFPSDPGGPAIQYPVLTYHRGDQIKTATVIPVTGLVPDKYAIGIGIDNAADLRLPVWTALVAGGQYTWDLMEETVSGLYVFVANIFQGQPDFSQVTGPVGIAGIVGDAAHLGFTYLVMVTAVISINLGVVNLIPFPALDGGRILFVALEGLFRRRIPARFTNIVNTVGFALLMLLMIVVTYRDIAKLVK